MKKLLNILTSFTIISTFSSNLIACDFKNDDTNNNDTVKIEKNKLEKAKDFLSKGITVTDVLPGKTVKDYIEHIKKVNEGEIDSDINFILDDIAESTTISDQQETTVTVILEDGEKNEAVNFKLKLLDKDLIVDNILNQAKTKITNIVGIGLLATDNIDEIVKEDIVKLIKEKIDSRYINVEWSSESTLTSLVTEGENNGKVSLSVVESNDNDNYEILKSEIVDFSITNVLDSEQAVNQQLVENAVTKIQEIDAALGNIEENVKLNDADFKTKMIFAIDNTINDSRIKVILNEEDVTLKEKENKISVKLSTGIGDNLFEKEDISILLLNVLSGEKNKNKAILSSLKQQLTPLDGSSLNSNLSITDKKIWEIIKQKIKEIVGDADYSRIHVTAPFSVASSSSIQQVFNNVKKETAGKRTPASGQGQPGKQQQGSGQGQPGRQTTGSGQGQPGRQQQGSGQGQPGRQQQGSGQGQPGRQQQGSGQKQSTGATEGTGKGRSAAQGQTAEGTSPQSSNNNWWSKNSTLASTNNVVAVLTKVGSGKDKVQDLILVKFNNVTS